MKKWVEKAPSTHVPTYVLSRLIYEMGGYTWLLCAHGQMTLCDLLYMDYTCSHATPLAYFDLFEKQCSTSKFFKK